MPSKQQKVFIIDDSKIALEAARRILEKAGFLVSCRSDAIGSTAAAMREHPDLVLVDVSMPAMKGSDLVRTIKQRGMMPSVPVLLWSSMPRPELERIAGECGADGCIEKGGDLAGLASEVRGFLKQPAAS
jgi:CheY-like chemotaxis protein